MRESDIRTTVVGSYPLPSWLCVVPSRTTLRDAIMVVMKTQELAGIDVIADGELSRFDVNHPDTNGMIDYFVRPLGGVQTNLSRQEIDLFRASTGHDLPRQPAGVVQEKLTAGTLNLRGDWEFVRGLTDRPLKFTLTSPYMLAKTLVDKNYRDRRDLTMALADVLHEQLQGIDAAVIQIDEANLPGTPQDGPWVAEAINRVLAGTRGETAVHICFGNYGGQTIQKGVYRDMLPFFNALECNHLVLEFARRGYSELDVFKDLKPSIALGIGVIDIKDNEIESPQEVAQRIEEAVRILGKERIRWIHPDCGFWMLSRSVADRKMGAMVAGRDLVTGR